VQLNRDRSWLKDWRVRGLAAAAFFLGFLISLGIFGKPWGLPPAWGDIPTWILAIGALITAWYAARAFAGQSREVAAIEQQVSDGQELARQQAKLLELQGKQLEVQSGQLKLQQKQIDEQRELNERQSEVLRLQADDLRESLAERKREAEARRVAQASRVFITQTIDGNSASAWIGAYKKMAGSVGALDVTLGAKVVNTSDQPIYDVELCWHRGPWLRRAQP
jgi:hypothetical protein